MNHSASPITPISPSAPTVLPAAHPIPTATPTPAATPTLLPAPALAVLAPALPPTPTLAALQVAPAPSLPPLHCGYFGRPPIPISALRLCAHAGDHPVSRFLEDTSITGAAHGTHTLLPHTEPPNELLDPQAPHFVSELRRLKSSVPNLEFVCGIDNTSDTVVASLYLSSVPDRRYELWILDFFLCVQQVQQHRDRWLAASTFVAHLEGAADSECWVELARNRIQIMPWHGNLRDFCPGTATSSLPTLLTDGRVRQDVMAAFVDKLCLFNGKRAWITPPGWVSRLQSLQLVETRYEPLLLSSLDRWLLSSSLRWMGIPVELVSGWILVYLDLEERLYWYLDPCDSSATPHPTIIETLLWWLDEVSPGRNFRLGPVGVGVVLDPANQTRSGLSVMNGIAELAQGTPLFRGDPDRPDLQSLWWFLCFTGGYDLLAMVCISLSLTKPQLTYDL